MSLMHNKLIKHFQLVEPKKETIICPYIIYQVCFIVKPSVYPITDHHKTFEDTTCTSDTIVVLQDINNGAKLKILYYWETVYYT